MRALKVKSYFKPLIIGGLVVLTLFLLLKKNLPQDLIAKNKVYRNDQFRFSLEYDQSSAIYAENLNNENNPDRSYVSFSDERFKWNGYHDDLQYLYVDVERGKSCSDSYMPKATPKKIGKHTFNYYENTVPHYGGTLYMLSACLEDKGFRYWISSEAIHRENDALLKKLFESTVSSFKLLN